MHPENVRLYSPSSVIVMSWPALPPHSSLYIAVCRCLFFNTPHTHTHTHTHTHNTHIVTFSLTRPHPSLSPSLSFHNALQSRGASCGLTTERCSPQHLTSTCVETGTAGRGQCRVAVLNLQARCPCRVSTLLQESQESATPAHPLPIMEFQCAAVALVAEHRESCDNDKQCSANS